MSSLDRFHDCFVNQGFLQWCLLIYLCIDEIMCQTKSNWVLILLSLSFWLKMKIKELLLAWCSSQVVTDSLACLWLAFSLSMMVTGSLAWFWLKRTWYLAHLRLDFFLERRMWMSYRLFLLICCSTFAWVKPSQKKTLNCHWSLARARIDDFQNTRLLKSHSTWN